MYYSRAGLVALVFALIISLVSAVPISATEPKLSSTLSPYSNPRLNGQDVIQHARISDIPLSGRMSTLPLATRLTRRQQIPIDMDDQLVRRSIGSKIKHAFQSLGRKIKKGFQKAGSAIKKGFQNAGTAIKKGFQKVGAGIKKAAKKVWRFVKTTGAKIAKVGLKVVQTVGEVAGHVVSYIPRVGKRIQQGIQTASKVFGVISDNIHVKLSDKLEKGMKGMEIANKIMKYIPNRRQ